MKQIILFSLILFLSLKLKASPQPDSTVIYKTIGDVELAMHFFFPPNHQITDKSTAIVFFHGGGFIQGVPSQFYGQCEYLASRGMVCMSAQYRTKKANGTTPIECIKDGKSAMRWVQQHAAEYGINAEKILAGGGSAGGHIAAATALLSGFNEEGENTSVSCLPNALVLFNPVLNNGPDGYGFERVGEFYKEFSPHHNLSENAPPTLIMVGTEDKLFTPNMAKAYKKKMEDFGQRCDLIFYQGQDHAFFNKNNSAEMYYQTMIDADAFIISLGYLKGKPTTLDELIKKNN